MESAGVEGFLDNMKDLQEQDEDSKLWANFYQAWYEQYGNKEVGVKDIYLIASGNDSQDIGLLDDLFSSHHSERGRKSFLGKILLSKVDSIHGGLKLHKSSKTQQRATLYYLTEAAGVNRLSSDSPTTKTSHSEGYPPLRLYKVNEVNHIPIFNNK